MNVSRELKPGGFILERWSHYPPPSRAVTLLLGTLMIITLIVGFIGNLLVLILFGKYKSLRTTPNIFVVNIAVAELFMCVLCLPILIVNCINGHGSNDFILYLCDYDAFLTAFTGFTCILSLVALATDRCIVISRGVSSRSKHSRVIVFVICLVWTTAAVGASCPLFGFGNFVMEGSKITCSFDYFTRSKSNIAYLIMVELVFFGMPLVVITLCYVIIFFKVRSHELMYFRTRNSTDLNEVSLRRTSRNRTFEKTELKIARSAIIIIAVFCVSWLPYVVLCSISMFGDSSVITPTVVAIPGVFAKLATIINPALYALMHNNFKHKLFLCCTRQQQTTVNSPASRISDRDSSDKQLSNSEREHFMLTSTGKTNVQRTKQNRKTTAQRTKQHKEMTAERTKEIREISKQYRRDAYSQHWNTVCLLSLPIRNLNANAM